MHNPDSDIGGIKRIMENDMRQYIISIAVSAVVSTIVGIITPDKWRKYVHIVTGLVIVLCIASPVFSLLKSDIFEGFSYNDTVVSKDGEEMLRGELTKELSERIENDISERLKKENGINCSAEVKISVNDEGAIEGVDEIILYGDKMNGAVYSRLKEIYGTDEVIYGGAEKNTPEQE